MSSTHPRARRRLARRIKRAASVVAVITITAAACWLALALIVWAAAWPILTLVRLLTGGP